MLMHEKLLGEASFYHPYIDVLPNPATTELWSDDDLAECQDSRFTRATMLLRRQKHRAGYQRLIGRLVDLFPDVFSFETYTLELYLFATRTVQARAFGRRLSWMALVPLADNLNHGNVSTKYDMNVNDNDVFRLYPTSGNCYTKGAEVFNSYGRRDNHHLLVYYGFTLINNEWDVFRLKFQVMELLSFCDNAHTRSGSHLPKDLSLVHRIALFMYISSSADVLSIQFQRGQLLWKLLLLARVASLPEAAARDMLHHLKNRQIIRASANGFLDSDDPDGNPHDLAAVTHDSSICSSAALARLPEMFTENRLEMPVSFAVELLAVETCIGFLAHRVRNGWPTSLKQDAALLREKSISHNLRSAINFRVYPKRLLLRNLLWMRTLRDTMKGSVATKGLLMRGSRAVADCCCAMATAIELAGQGGVCSAHRPVVLPASAGLAVVAAAPAPHAWATRADKDLCTTWVHHVDHLRGSASSAHAI